ncbi:MAG TPA: type II toxin-antitoxin system RelE/ParE family toxin [Thermohalobaculum sp.]|nr:type II toxin-antitoxin system RelE/ParE family toxin [Thermohalobaculum sp.]
MRIGWSPRAVRHLEAARAYIARDNPAAATAVTQRIIAQVERLVGFSPGIGRAGRIAGTRELVITRTPYVVVYRVAQDEVQVLAVIHQARAWPESL